MSAKSILGTLSPLYGAISGEGMMGKMLNPEEAARIAKAEQDRQNMMAEQDNADRQAQVKAEVTGGMKKGGKVKSKSASSRGDGIAQRGKTRGKMY
jgi:hypothetical protein